MKVLALTDHDTMAGIREAVSADSKFGIRIIPGVEMSIIQGKCLLAFSEKTFQSQQLYHATKTTTSHLIVAYSRQWSAVLFNVASPSNKIPL